MATIDKLAWIRIEDRKVLVALSRGKDVWYIPGGKREPQENDAEALMREIKEELSVSIVPRTITYVGTFEAPADGKVKGVDVKMSCYQADYDGSLAPAAEIAEFAWFTNDDVHRTSFVDKIIFEYLHDEGWID